MYETKFGRITHGEGVFLGVSRTTVPMAFRAQNFGTPCLRLYRMTHSKQIVREAETR